MRLAPWLPPVLWMAVTAWLSTDIASGEHTSQLLLPALRWLLPWATPGQLHTVHRLLRKGAHLTEYAILPARRCRSRANARSQRAARIPSSVRCAPLRRRPCTVWRRPALARRQGQAPAAP